ncbi:TetR/AcrR family transcriptional regulator [Microbacterium sp. NC79]|uniref:TetR/AcrR family transcriptional regulator n=1 Tax=Microbacterium sp. NC79 TaxID=2851009 RepID=UPI001C2C0CED|nr:TetR/AcrR family transcriptional regulator [Microbacterium sp. NC79]MBV0894751.1 TetR/AcrR family transcriptional regulator [Microbacterium sp. NC79]
MSKLPVSADDSAKIEGMDPRIARSRAVLHDAIIQLAGERSLDEITVADITTLAGVNRSTFYQHYSDKGALLADALQVAVDEATQALREMELAEPTDPMPPALLTYLTHIRDHAQLYRRVLGDHGSGVVAAQLRSHIGGIAIEVVTRVVPAGAFTIPTDVVGEAYGGTALGVVTAWLRHDPLPDVDVAAEWLWAMVVGTFVADPPPQRP